MNYLSQIMNWIAVSLLLPVMALLLLGFLSSLASLGGFCTFYLGVLRSRRQRAELMRLIRGRQPFDEQLRDAGSFGRALKAMRKLEYDPIHCAKYLADWRARREAELDRSRFLLKAGPMLGLMGTLIPMGPALAGLASGDIGSMAYNMQIAFATTVIGVLIAGVELLVLTVKRRRFDAEYSDLCYVLDLKLREASDEHRA